MKIRWNKSSIRFRITPGELQSLQNGAAIEEVLQLPGGAAWSTQVIPNHQTRLVFRSGVLQVHLGASDCAALSIPENEGVYFRDGEFRYFIEKDFPCAHPRASEAAEPKTETFAAPPNFEERKNS